MNAEEDPYQQIEKLGKTFSPDIIAISVRNIKVAKPGEHISSGRELQEMTRSASLSTSLLSSRFLEAFQNPVRLRPKLKFV